MKRLSARRVSHLSIPVSGLALVAIALSSLAGADDRKPDPSPSLTLERPNSPPALGTITGSAEAGFKFLPDDSSEAIPLLSGYTLLFPKAEQTPPSPSTPFQLLGGECLRISGALKSLDSKEIEFSVPWSDQPLRMARAAPQAIVQFPGESRIFADGFEQLDKARWTVAGSPESAEGPHVGGARSLVIRPGDNAISHNLEEPLPSGRLDLAFHDSGKIVPGNRCAVELTFRGPAGPKSFKIDLGWQEESLTVESTGGPALAVQRLARIPGWHRLVARFNADMTEISVDGKLLANGKGPVGPLIAIRLGSSATAAERARATTGEVACYFDDLQLVRYSEPPSSVEVDITQDEARLAVGDQLFGSIDRADADRFTMTVDTRTVEIPWSEAGGLYFKRTPVKGVPVEGPLVRVQWSPGSQAERREPDFAEGALTEVSATTISLATPYTGTLRLPRDRVRSIAVRGIGRRIVLDIASHHLGDEISVEPPLLDPPFPEGNVLERTIELSAPLEIPSSLSLDVLLVVGEEAGLQFSEYIRKGQLKTYVAIGGKRIDYLNRHIKTGNETAERIRIPIPAGTLRAGKNVIRIEQTATADNPTYFDDLGILQMALEIDPGAGNANAP